MERSQTKSPPAGLRERRRFGRRLAVSKRVEVAGSSGGFSAQTVNVSRTGVLLWVVDERFLPLAESENMLLFTERVAEEFGEGLEIRLGEDVALEAEVVRVTRRNEKDVGPVLIACRYARPLSQEEWRRLDLERLPPGDIEEEMNAVLGESGRDRRQALRVPCEQPVEIHSEYAAYRAQVVDLSAVGVLLQMTDPAFAAPTTADRLLVCTRRLGTQFGHGMRVRFLEADLTVEGEIVRVGERKSAGGVDILVGCRFEPPLDAVTCERLGIETAPRSPAVSPEPAPGPSRAREFLAVARAQGATDLHLKAGSPPRARVGGTLTNLDRAPLDPAETRAIAADLLDEARTARLEARGHAEAVVELADLGRFRVNAVRQQGATALAIRTLPARLPELAPDQRALAMLDQGLVLLAGRGGSGRTTTLAAILDQINHGRACHILTLEDPVEIPHREVAAHITQRDLAADRISVHEALRQSRHLDVDVLAVARLASCADLLAVIEAAETGRLVFAVVDAGSPEEAIERMLQLAPPDRRPGVGERLARVLRAAASQRLVHADDGGARVEADVRRLGDADREVLRAGLGLPASRNGTISS